MTLNYLKKWKRTGNSNKHRIYSQDIGMEFGIEKCTIFVMKSGKRHITDGKEYQIKTRLERSEKRKPTNSWASLRLTSSNKWRRKKKLRKNISGELESYSRQNCLAETLSKE